LTAISGRVFRFYNQKVYPEVKDRRGATRIKKILGGIASKKLEEVETSSSIDNLDFRCLVVLDGCRNDSFQKIVSEESQFRISEGSNSREFIKANFSSGDFSDTVVVTANPYYNPSHFNELTGRDIEDVFDTLFHLYDTEWDEELSTVKAEDVVEKALLADRLFSDKRLLLHFMQPHYPFIGQVRVDGSGIRIVDGCLENDTAWDLAEKGELSSFKVRRAYEENLRYVWEYVEDLAENLDREEVIVTADHGNLLGENGLYGHSENFVCEGLRKVPLATLSQCSESECCELVVSEFCSKHKELLKAINRSDEAVSL